MSKEIQTETKTTKIMKIVVITIFLVAILLGITSFILDDTYIESNTVPNSQERPF